MEPRPRYIDTMDHKYANTIEARCTNIMEPGMEPDRYIDTWDPRYSDAMEPRRNINPPALRNLRERRVVPQRNIKLGLYSDMESYLDYDNSEKQAINDWSYGRLNTDLNDPSMDGNRLKRVGPDRPTQSRPQTGTVKKTQNTEPRQKTEDTEPHKKTEDTEPGKETEDTAPRKKTEDTEPHKRTENTAPPKKKDTAPRKKTENTASLKKKDTAPRKKTEDTKPNRKTEDTDQSSESTVVPSQSSSRSGNLLRRTREKISGAFVRVGQKIAPAGAEGQREESRRTRTRTLRRFRDDFHSGQGHEQ